MANKYLVIDNFYLKDDFSSFLLYVDYFRIQAYILQSRFNNTYIRRITFALTRIITLALYVVKFYSIRYKTVFLEDNAILIFKGKGEWTNNIKLINDNGRLKIIKKTFSTNVYIKEKAFYTMYKNTTSQIHLPQHTFLDNNTIEIEFIRAKSFQRLIVDGTLSFDDSIKQLQKIKTQLKKFYGKTPTLIHGDFWVTNIFIKNQKYYLIDYSDSFTCEPLYDVYLLLYSILAVFKLIKLNEKTICKFLINQKPAISLLNISRNKILKFEKLFTTYRKKRFGEAFYTLPI